MLALNRLLLKGDKHEYIYSEGRGGDKFYTHYPRTFYQKLHRGILHDLRRVGYVHSM
jgi:hypothetical protein